MSQVGIPQGWQQKPLAKVADIDRRGMQPDQIPFEARYVGLEHVDGDGNFIGIENAQSAELKSMKFTFTDQHILYGKLRPYLKKISRPEFSGVCSTDILPIRLKNGLDKNYLFHYLRQQKLVDLATTRCSGANLPRLSPKALAEFPVIYPTSPDEQKRIAAILDKADAIRRKRRQALALADQFLRSVFLEMFGDPMTNPKGWRKEPLSKMVRFVSGGTPSKDRADFWDGTFPWVSPKDMKSIEINDAEDHVSDAAFSETSLKVIPEGAILIVVRGMIIAHTVPVAITTNQVAINQDMKALIVKNSLIPEFSLYCLRVQHSHLLSRISTAAHGTKRFDMQDLHSIGMLVPDHGLQDQFRKIVLKFRFHQHKSGDSVAGLNDLFGSLTQRAFRGEL
ncbi:MAG: restriction endonuclease subunit S [Magnetococcales bacterium]|nr:restriction endonuclease subunit S [Magnetococcales bacterium]